MLKYLFKLTFTSISYPQVLVVTLGKFSIVFCCIKNITLETPHLYKKSNSKFWKLMYST